MNELTKITIVTISYNSEKTIERTIQSVISQKYDNTEYWIIDGKSTDSTMKIVKEYAEKYDFINTFLKRIMEYLMHLIKESKKLQGN